MKCTNRKLLAALSAWLFAAFLCGCGGIKYDFAYDPDYKVSSFQVTKTSENLETSSFAQNLCIVSADVSANDLNLENAGAACLFDLGSSDVLYSKNAHERLNPASLTKIMTALAAVKYGSMDQVLTATNNVNITESGAQLCGLKAGDSMTLDQALHILLMYSANDVAMLIAENIGGSVEGFLEMMNTEAVRLGATNTHFANPHGLTQDNHYTTAYDLYLIFNEALKYESITQIMHMSAYETVYTDKDGKSKELSVKTTNRYLRGDFNPPENITVIGGKTGTTNAAGACLILLTKDTSGNSYVSVILRDPTSDDLYLDMTSLLREINNQKERFD